MPTVIFDLDGTLADTSGDLIAAANTCFLALGAGPVLDFETDRGVAMQSIQQLLKTGFRRIESHASEALIEEYYQVTLIAYGNCIADRTYLYPGALDAINNLRNTGYRVGICTNKPIQLAEMLLTKLKIRNLFHSVVGAGSLPVLKPDAKMLTQAVRLAGGTLQKSVLIGDTITDLNTARAAGRPSVLVTFGPGGDELERLLPDALLDHFDNLPVVVADLIGPAI